jgi:hypothetical protein
MRSPSATQVEDWQTPAALVVACTLPASTTKPGGIPIFARSAPSGDDGSLVNPTAYDAEVVGFTWDGAAAAVNVLIGSAEAPEATSMQAAAAAAAVAVVSARRWERNMTSFL